MRQPIDFTVVDAIPDVAALLRREAAGRPVPLRLERVFQDARHLFERLAAPRGILTRISGDEFEAIYAGEGLNAPDTPLHAIVPRAQRLALFAATVGDPLSEEIGTCFRRGDPAVGYALDVIASEATALLADALARRFERNLLDSLGPGRPPGDPPRALPYSPGYCGWHISGQRRLFDALHAETIGIRLSASFLMRPLKSVSGVLVAGPAAIHRFSPTYPFCDDCTSHECRKRMSSVLHRRR